MLETYPSLSSSLARRTDDVLPDDPPMVVVPLDIGPVPAMLMMLWAVVVVRAAYRQLMVNFVSFIRRLSVKGSRIGRLTVFFTMVRSFIMPLNLK